jgi:uncharacterized protein YdhG (YjbR/CyaY superfamily)
MSPSPNTVDEYLEALPDDQRAALEQVRAMIKAAAPDAAEAISYGMPGYKFKGRPLIHFGAAKNHCAIYGAVVADADEDALKGYDTSKGTIRFSPERPLPAVLVTKLVTARLNEIEAGSTAYRRKKKSNEGEVA